MDDPEEFEAELQADYRAAVEATKRRRKRPPSTVTLIARAQKAGLTVNEIRPDGTLVTSKSEDAKSGNDGWRDVVIQ